LRNNSLIIVASILAAFLAASLCQAAPNCCDPAKSTTGPVTFSPVQQVNSAAAGPTSALPPCCAQMQPSYAQRQPGCCGRVAPQATPQSGGCCGSGIANVAPSPSSCCTPAGAISSPPQQGCCGANTQGYAVPRGACCNPAKGSLQRVPGVTSLPAATPVLNTAVYSGPTITGPIEQPSRTVQQSSNRPSMRPIPIEPAGSSFSYAKPIGLW
jgi:hypothetical protein